MARVLANLALVVAVVAILAVALPGPFYRFGLTDLSVAFGMMKYGAFAGMLGGGLGLIGLVVSRIAHRPGSAVRAVLGLVLGGVAWGIPYAMLRKAESLPVIHDITTDVVNPPQFQPDVLALRAAAHAVNSTVYAGASVAALQEKAYPDIRTMTFDLPVARVFDAARRTADALGWKRVSADPRTGLIEASDTTFWFGFTDDVVIRVEPSGSGSRLDIRSESRVGESDLGKNAQRIRAFRAALDARLGRATRR
ncbi:MAG: DUF1499 domain-containing protein [Gammaproteobacteria bacterium]|nr:DUF1499 domain-containing protein [Gammaproteobacteria bacterium]